MGRNGSSVVQRSLFGIGLFLSAFVLIGWNERNAVQELRAIEEISAETLADVPADRVQRENEGKLVHIATLATTDDLVGNAVFDIEENAIRVSWNSSIFQVVESESRDDDGDIEYSYRSRWVDDVVNSSNFNSRRSSNDGSRKTLPTDDRSQATNVTFGAFTLSETLVDQIDNDTLLPLSAIPEAFRGKGALKEGQYYTGDPDDPEIGDERIRFTIVESEVDATIIAQQRASGLQGYLTKSGKTKEILYVGILSKDDVVARQHSEARRLRWALRAAGFMALWIALGLVLEPLRRLARPLPIVGQLVEGATAIISAAIALVLTLVAVAVFWFAFRPLLSAAVLLVALVVFGAAVLRSRRSAEQATAARAKAVAAADYGRSPRVEGYKALKNAPDPALQDFAPPDAVDRSR